MSDAAPFIRLVPADDRQDGIVRVFACTGADAVRRALAALPADPGPAFEFAGFADRNERWLDTGDRRLLGAGYVLRIENLGHGGSLDGDAGQGPTASAPPQAARLTPLGDGAPFEGAEEHVQPLDAADPRQGIAVPGPVGDRVRSLCATRPLVDVASLKIRRHEFRGQGEYFGFSLHLDELRVVPEETRDERVVGRLTLVAVRSRADRVEALVAALEEPCSLAPAASLARSVAEAAELRPAPPPDLGSETIDGSATVAGLAYAVLRRHGRTLARLEPATRLGDDAEALHDMRVALRRLRAALALFGPYLPKRAGGLAEALRRLGERLGAVRDLDVRLKQLAAWRLGGDLHDQDAFDAIEPALRRQRDRARHRLLATLDGEAHRRLTARLEEFLRHPPSRSPAGARRPACEAAPERIGRAYRAVRKAGRRLEAGSSPASYHALRIRARRLRYALESYQPFYDGDVAAMIEALTSLQRVLGEHQDAEVAAVHLEALASGRGRPSSPRALFLMGAIAGRCSRRARALRRAVPKAYRKIRGKRWKALKSTLATPCENAQHAPVASPDPDRPPHRRRGARR